MEWENVSFCRSWKLPVHSSAGGRGCFRKRFMLHQWFRRWIAASEATSLPSVWIPVVLVKFVLLYIPAQDCKIMNMNSFPHTSHTSLSLKAKGPNSCKVIYTSSLHSRTLRCFFLLFPIAEQEKFLSMMRSRQTCHISMLLEIYCRASWNSHQWQSRQEGC